MNFDIWQLLGGVGLLIFGMNLLERALYTLGGHRLKHYLQHYTSSMWLAVPVGMLTTIIMGGSGDLVTLLTMAMFSAGLINLKSSLGIIFGSNIGATSLPLIVSLFGFGNYDFAHIVLPLIAIGGVMLLLLKSEKAEQIAKALIGFSLLFVAIEWMSESITTSGFDISQYKDASLRGFGALGAILAMIIQSGGAIGIITLTALKEGIITFPASIAIMMGVNIGTTNTPFLGALGGKREKVQIAVSHVLFNVFSAIIGIVFFWQYIWIGQDFFSFAHNESLSSAVINFIFNTSTALLFAMLVGPFERLVRRITPSKSNEPKLEVEELQEHAHHLLYAMPLGIAFRKDTRNYISESILLTDSRIRKRMLNSLINKPISEASYTPEMNEKLIEKSKKLLAIAIDIQRTAKNTETIAVIDQCKLSIRQCYHVLELIQRTDTALKSDVVYIPDTGQESQQTLADQLSFILEEIQTISNHEDGKPIEHIRASLHILKEMRLGVLKRLTTNVKNDEKHDETLSEMIIFTQRLYQIIKKLLTSLDYAFLSPSEQEIIEHEIE